MERFNFSAGHIFIEVDYWSIFMNGAGSCGSDGMEGLMNSCRLSDKLKSEIKGIFEPVGKQLELF